MTSSNSCIFISLVVILSLWPNNYIFRENKLLQNALSFCQAGERHIICGGRQHLGGNNFLSSVQANLSPTLVRLIAANLVKQTQPFRGRGVRNQKILKSVLKKADSFSVLIFHQVVCVSSPTTPALPCIPQHSLSLLELRREVEYIDVCSIT